MTAPYLIPCLTTLRAEFNAVGAPDRDKSSDGWIGDAAHQQEKESDHNPDSKGRVLAIDIDSTGPWPVHFAVLVNFLVGDSRLEYVIFDRRIASRDQGWAWRPYSGADPHTNHAHFSARHDHTGGTSTAPWGLEEEYGMDPKDVWAERIPLQSPTETAAGALWDLHGRVPGDLASILPQVQANGAALSALTLQVADLARMVALLSGVEPKKLP